MAAPKTPLLRDLKDAVGSLGADLREMAALRWQLAWLELKADALAVKRLAVALVLSAVMGLCGLSVLAVFAAEMLDGFCGLARSDWLLLFGTALLFGGAAAGYLAWRRFRRRFTGMEQSLAELREDAVWLQEWTAAKAEDGERQAEE
jgi:protein-S-isoprenylcysteine O-methyltransferase Ste14